MFVAYFDFYLLLICIMLWLFAANKVVYITIRSVVTNSDPNAADLRESTQVREAWRK